jgi:hypothetical protein
MVRQGRITMLRNHRDAASVLPFQSLALRELALRTAIFVAVHVIFIGLALHV